MQGPYLAAAAPEAAGNVHETAGIGCDHGAGPGLLDERDFILDHGTANPRVTHREGPTKAAAFIGALEGYVFQSLDAAQQPLGFGLEAESAEVTGHVIGRLALKPGANILDPQDVYQKIRELMGSPAQFLGSSLPDRVLVK